MTRRIANRVREVRETRGLSQVALASAVGIARQSIHAIETARATPAVDVALGLARVLDCSVETLFGEATDNVRLHVEMAAAPSANHTGRVALAYISGRWIGYALEREGIGHTADAIAEGIGIGMVEVSHLARRGLRLAVREPGSGARRLLDRELKQSGLGLDRANAASFVANGHLEVARAITQNLADVGIATRDAAIAFGLDFVPLTEERYDLALPRDDLADPRIARLFDVMTAAPLRRELASLGYDVGPSGDRVAEITSA